MPDPSGKPATPPGTITNGTLLAEGKFLRGRPASIDWHLKY